MSIMPSQTGAFTPKRELVNILYYVNSIADSWQEKLVFGGALAFLSSLITDSQYVYNNALDSYASVFGGNPFLVRLLVILFFVDLGLGLLCSFVKKDENGVRLWRPSIFARGICKGPIYGIYVIVVAFVAASLEHSIGWGTPLLNCFVSYMTISEARSVLKNIERLGVRIPSLLSWLVHGAHEKVESVLRDKLRTSVDRRIGQPDTREERIERRQNTQDRRHPVPEEESIDETEHNFPNAPVRED